MLVGLVAAWYAASVGAVLTCKLALDGTGAPATLCCLQLCMACLMCRRQLGGAAVAVGAGERALVRGIAASYALGFLLTNAAIAIAAPSFVETFKAAEPLSTVLLAAAFLGERERAATLLALLPIVLGVALASSGSAAYSRSGMLAACASNVAFSSRSVLTKRLKASHPSSAVASSDAALFYHVSRLGLALLLPCALWLDARRLLSALAARPAPRSATLVLLLLANAACHATYNGVSFMVLSRVSVASHAVVNICRRVVCIAAAAAAFATPVSALNWLGVGIAVAGAAAFARSKGAAGSAPGRPLLPMFVSRAP